MGPNVALNLKMERCDIDRALHAHHPWHFDPASSFTTEKRKEKKTRHHPTVLGAAIPLQLKDYHLSSKLWGAFYFLILHAICSGESPG